MNPHYRAVAAALLLIGPGGCRAVASFALSSEAAPQQERAFQLRDALAPPAGDGGAPGDQHSLADGPRSEQMANDGWREARIGEGGTSIDGARDLRVLDLPRAASDQAEATLAPEGRTVEASLADLAPGADHAQDGSPKDGGPKDSGPKDSGPFRADGSPRADLPQGVDLGADAPLTADLQGARDSIVFDVASDLPPTLAPWAYGVAGPKDELVNALAFDDGGNLYGVASFTGSFEGTAARGVSDGVLFKLSPGGRLLWYRVFSSNAGAANAIALAITADRLIVAGSYSGTLQVGALSLAAAINTDVFVVNLALDGTPVWGGRLGAARNQIPASVAVDTSGGIYLSCTTDGDFAVGSTTFSPVGQSDLCVIALAADGTERWVAGIGSKGADLAGSIAVHNNSLYLGGQIAREVTFAAATIPTIGGAANGILASLTTAGAPRWARGFVSGGHDDAFAVGVDEAGNVYAGGSISADVDFGGGLIPVANRQAFLASYGMDGSYRWAVVLPGGTGGDVIWALQVAQDQIFAAGAFTGPLQIANDPLLPIGGADFLLARYDLAGNAIGAQSYGGRADDEAYCVGLGGQGQIALGGFTTGNISHPPWNGYQAGADGIVLYQPPLP